MKWIDAFFQKRALADARAEVRSENEHGGTLALATKALRLGTSRNDLNLDAGRQAEVALNEIGPRLTGKGHVAVGACRQSHVEIHQRDAQPIVRLLAEALAEQQAEDQDEHERHADEQERREAIAQQQPQLFLCDRPRGHWSPFSDR